jgi:glycosyltransferase involved in cell wall biosynthesis
VRPLRHLYRRLLENSDFQILNNSRRGLLTDVAWLGANGDSKFKVLPNALDLGDDFLCDRNDVLRQNLKIPADAVVVGSVFRFVPVKRPFLWLEAARLVAEALPNSHFVIVGDGPLLPEFRHAVTEAKLEHRFHLPGKLPNVSDWYRVIDVLLLTSSREGFPNVILEGQYFGLPVVATDVGGVSEITLPNITGFLVSGHGAEEYAINVIELARNPELLSAAKREGSHFVRRHFALEAVVEQMLRYYGIEPDASSSDFSRLDKNNNNSSGSFQSESDVR